MRITYETCEAPTTCLLSPLEAKPGDVFMLARDAEVGLNVPPAHVREGLLVKVGIWHWHSHKNSIFLIDMNTGTIYPFERSIPVRLPTPPISVKVVD